MLEKKKIASLLKQLLLVTMFPSKKITSISERVRQVQKGKAVSFDSFFDSYSNKKL